MLCDLEIKPPGELCEDADKIKIDVRSACGWLKKSFPGSQPVSLTRQRLLEINFEAFVACEKTDGVRYLLYACGKSIYLIDRKEAVYRLDMHLPSSLDPDVRQHKTLLDGELVEDVLPDGSTIRRFLVYDAVEVEAEAYGGLNLIERLRVAFTKVIKPRADWEINNVESVEVEKKKDHYLSLFLKDFFEIWDITAIGNFSKRLPHESDGVIFTPVNRPYEPGTCLKLFKWKPPNLNTVDFLVELITANRVINPPPPIVPSTDPRESVVAVRLISHNKGIPQFYGEWLALKGAKLVELIQKHITRERPADFGIWECYYDPDVEVIKPYSVLEDSQEIIDFSKAETVMGGWCVERMRTDKTTPNDKRVVDSVFQSIKDGVSFEELIATFHMWFLEGKQTVAESCKLPDYYKKHGSLAYRQRVTADVVKNE